MIPFESQSNYYEIFLNHDILRDSNPGMQEFKVAMSEDKFKMMLSQMAQANILNTYKFFQKEYKEYIYSDVIVHNYKNLETRVIRCVPQIVLHNNKSLLMGYIKSKLTFLNVPSTINIYEINYVRKLIFRVSNRIFINFQTSISEQGDKTYMVYINYNHDNNIDPERITNTLQKVFDIFGITPPQESIC